MKILDYSIRCETHYLVYFKMTSFSFKYHFKTLELRK